LEAGQLIQSLGKEGIDYRKKGNRDLVTAADLASEKLIVQRILDRFPDHVIVAEEAHSTIDGALNRPTWIIDPLDGTTNFVHGIPHVAVSIAYWSDGKPQLACVANPRLNECFSAARGGGATRNGQRISVSATDLLSDALLATGFHYKREESKDSNLAHVGDFLFQVRCLRRFGAASLDLCYVACGRLDGYWELLLSPWDVAAGGLIALEAGAWVTDFRGKDDWLLGGEIVAANATLHPEMLRVLGSAKSENLPGPRCKLDA
jgi:myo-inositol-1(or 4)-monophosphatase